MDSDRAAAILRAASALRSTAAPNGSTNGGSAPKYTSRATTSGATTNTTSATGATASVSNAASSTDITSTSTMDTSSNRVSSSTYRSSTPTPNSTNRNAYKRPYEASSSYSSRPGPSSSSFRTASSLISSSSSAPAATSTSSTTTSSISSSTTANSKPLQATSNIIVNRKKQKENPMLKLIRGVGWHFDEIVPDFITGHNSCVIFLSIKYHNIHTEYIFKRIQQLNKSFEHRILLVLVDVDNPATALLQLDIVALRSGLQLVLTWSYEEAAKYLVLLKQQENAPATGISGQKREKYQEQLVEVMNRISKSSINKTDAVTLVSNFGSLKNAILDGGEHVELIHGWGSTKAKIFKDAITQPFINHRQYDMEPYQRE